MSKGDSQRPLPVLGEAMAKLDRSLDTTGERRLLAKQSLEVVIHTLQLVNRYRSTAEALEGCRAILQTLQ